MLAQMKNRGIVETAVLPWLPAKIIAALVERMASIPMVGFQAIIADSQNSCCCQGLEVHSSESDTTFTGYRIEHIYRTIFDKECRVS